MFFQVPILGTHVIPFLIRWSHCYFAMTGSMLKSVTALLFPSTFMVHMSSAFNSSFKYCPLLFFTAIACFHCAVATNFKEAPHASHISMDSLCFCLAVVIFAMNSLHCPQCGLTVNFHGQWVNLCWALVMGLSCTEWFNNGVSDVVFLYCMCWTQNKLSSKPGQVNAGREAEKDDR